MAEINKKVIEEVIQVPWGVIALKCWNSADSNPVLVVHGLSENAGAFDRLIPMLSPNFYFVAVDLPGHGRSSSIPEGFPLDFMHYVHQLKRVVGYFKWKKLILMGHSFGAHLLEFYAATYTEQVEKLILIDAISPTPLPNDVFLEFYRNLAKNEIEYKKQKKASILYSYKEALEHMTNDRMTKLEPEAAENLLQRCLKKTGMKYKFTTDKRTRLEIKPAIDENVIFDVLKRIKCPVLIILGDNSEQRLLFNSFEFFTSALDILKQTHSASRAVRIVGNHCVHNNQPEIIAPVINSFLMKVISKM